MPLRQRRSSRRTIIIPVLDTGYIEREIIKCSVLKSGKWTASKHELISKYIKSFLLFIKLIKFDQS